MNICKFTGMKADILQRLTKAGLISVFRNHPIWAEAFEEYKKVTGDLQVSTKCGSCYRKVARWLKQ